MAKARARTTARKVKDKWKAKQWYTIVAPAAFNQTTLAESPAEAPEQIIGRIATTTMQDLIGDFKLMHVKLNFQVTAVNGNRAETRFIGHSFTSDYLRRLVRRNHSKITLVIDVKTKDEALIRIKPILVTEHRAQASQQNELRRICTDILAGSAARNGLGAFVREMLDGTLTNQLFKEARKIYPLRKAELQKSEVVSAPTITLEDLTPPAPAEQPGEGAPPAEAPAESGATEGTDAPETEADEPAEEEEGRTVEVAPGSRDE